MNDILNFAYLILCRLSTVLHIQVTLIMQYFSITYLYTYCTLGSAFRNYGIDTSGRRYKSHKFKHYFSSNTTSRENMKDMTTNSYSREIHIILHYRELLICISISKIVSYQVIMNLQVAIYFKFVNSCVIF